MSQIDDLITQMMSEEDIEAYLADTDSEPHIVVNSDRSITVPQQLKDIAVQYDHNIETVTFDCPRYWDGKDMSTMVIFVLYERSDKFVGKVAVTNVRVSDTDDSIMHFDWTIRREATQCAGNLNIQICVGETDDIGRTIVHWNSKVCSDLVVSKSLMHVGEDIEQEYPDVLTELYERVGDIEEEIQNIEVGDIDVNAYTKDETDILLNNKADKSEIAWINDRVDITLSVMNQKADKSSIGDYKDTTYTYRFKHQYNAENRFVEVSSISFTFDDGEYHEDHISGLSFDSGATPTAIDYTNSGILNWVGTDCTVSSGLSIFQPSPNTHYDIVFYFNGKQFIGLVNGFVPATGNEAV